jgi:LPPG:FO 2-phospho-L-lactate transferase
VSGQVVVLTGGVGGAKLVLGLAQILPPEKIVAIVNTGDDFEHLGLRISPDVDTLLYTLSGKANAAQGWGREGESWAFLDALRSLGGEDWFALGDGDLALHVLRTLRLSQGATLSTVIDDFARAWGLALRVFPMTDDRVETRLATDQGELAFQQYFVRERCAPIVRKVLFEGAGAARPAPGVIEAIRSTDTRAILIAPSNPYLSIDPILAVPGIKEALQSATAPVVAISPIVGGKAVKGPTAKLMGELSIPITPAAIARHYGDLLDGILIDEQDAPDGIAIAHAACDTMMHTLADRARVAEAALAVAAGV